MDRYTKYALYVAIFCGLWLSFKYVEPAVFPVVKDFRILNVENYGEDSLLITGEMDKVRSCEFIEVIGYSGEKFIKIEYITANTRLARKQTYGPWLLTPKVGQLELYSRHLCFTGEVVTPLFNGAVAL